MKKLRRLRLLGMSHVRIRKNKKFGYVLVVDPYDKMTLKEIKLLQRDIVYKFNHYPYTFDDKKPHVSAVSVQEVLEWMKIKGFVI